MANQFTRTRQIDTRDRRNKFARPDTSDMVQYVSEHCKKIIKKMLKRCIDLLTYILKSILAIIKDLVSPYVIVKHTYDNDRKPAFSMLEKAIPGRYKLDQLYEPRDKVFNIYKQLHEDIVKKFYANDFYGCMDACNLYIRETNSPAYLNHVRATKCKKELDQIMQMTSDAIKYSSDSLLLTGVF